MLNPFEAPKTTAEIPSAGFDVRRQELSPQVRSYVDTLYVQIRQIFDKYKVANIEDLRDGVKSKKIKMESKDGEKLKELTRWLRDTLKERKLRDEPIKELGEFALENVPRWDKLPSADVLKDKVNGFKFDYISATEFHEDRQLSDFEFIDGDASAIGFEPSRRASIMKAMAEERTIQEDWRIARIFDIADVIKNKQQQNPGHAGYLTIGEVMEAIDDAGYRPATLLELLAYNREQTMIGKTFEEDISAKEKKGRFVGRSLVIYALGAPFVSLRENFRFVPYSTWQGKDHRLAAGGFTDTVWFGDTHFLVIRKQSA